MDASLEPYTKIILSYWYFKTLSYFYNYFRELPPAPK